MADLITYHGDSKVIGRICELINSMTGVSFRKVQTLPQTGESNVIYLVPKSTSETDNVFDEYIWIDNDWELIGTTEIDLSDYYTKTETDDLLDDKADIGDIPTVNNATLTLQKDGTNIPQGTFTANASANKTINIDNTDKVNWVSNGILGAKNLNSYPYYETNHTEAGIAWTDNGDGTVTANNTSTGNSSFICHSRIAGRTNPLILPNGKYILSGCPSGGSSTTYRVIAYVTKNGSASALGTDYGEGVLIEVNGDDNFADKAYVQIGCDIRSTGYVANNLTFKPMVRLAEDTDNTWRPYSMTNKELTKKANWVDLGSLTSAITVDDVYSEYRAIVGITVSGFDKKYFTIDLLPNELTSTEKSFTQCTPCQTQTNLSSTYLAIGGVKAKKENAQVTIRAYGNYGGSISGQVVTVAVSGNLYAKA